MKTRLAAGVLVVFLLVSQSFAWWGRRSGLEKMDQGRMMERIVKRLGLTQEQSDKFTAQAEAMQKSIKADRDKIAEAGEKLKAELQKDNPDKDAVHDLITQIGQARAQMQIARLDSMLELQKILTPEQKAKFKEMLNRKSGRMPFGFGGSRH